MDNSYHNKISIKNFSLLQA